uniref:Ig-like domain-containing protein n=1 Tax=Gadus morhua TaxID=8049 RepID=A0A8C5FUD1_GADMO
MSGCEWDDEDDTTYGHEQYAYDGEDFLAFDLKTLTWVAAVRQAVPSKLRLDQNRAGNQRKKNYLTKECVDLLKKLLAYGKSTLQRTERPRVSLLQRSPSSPVVCHATGFYPDRVVVFWRRDGQELHEQVDPGEVLPNHDGTFQCNVFKILAESYSKHKSLQSCFKGAQSWAICCIVTKSCFPMFCVYSGDN